MSGRAMPNNTFTAHALKTLPEFFEELGNGKTFEIRKDGREPTFDRGHILILQEWSPGGYFTGRTKLAEVTYCLRKAPYVPEGYEKKLATVMGRLGAEEFDYDFTRRQAWVEFRYRGQQYRMDQSVEKAAGRKVKLVDGHDCFAQVVLTLEDLARMVERGIYDLATWLEGMRALPAPVELPWYFGFLGFDRIPASVEEVQERYRARAKQAHPDQQGSSAEFLRLQQAREAAQTYFGAKEGTA